MCPFGIAPVKKAHKAIRPAGIKMNMDRNNKELKLLCKCITENTSNHQPSLFS